jgi:hypothetical protein
MRSSSLGVQRYPAAATMSNHGCFIARMPTMPIFRLATLIAVAVVEASLPDLATET